MEKIKTKKNSWWQSFKKKIDTRLKHQIEERPPDVKTTDICKKCFKYLDENKIVIYTLKQSNGHTFWQIGLFIFVFMWILSGTNEMFNTAFGIVVTIICSVLIIFGIIFQATIPKKEIVLYRKKGLFSFPGFMWHKGYTIPFKEAKVGWFMHGGTTGNLRMELIVGQPKREYLGTTLYAHSEDYDEIWNFYVWYMDKNRPLPPGEAFDPYRKNDFERRKAEGFPHPLYKSYVPTPEATPEQQAEREHYWTDEKYTEPFDREEGSVWYDPNVHKDWTAVTFKEPKTDAPISNRYVKFLFKDGRIIYSKTNDEGILYEPLKSEDFEMEFIKTKKDR